MCLLFLMRSVVFRWIFVRDIHCRFIIRGGSRLFIISVPVRSLALLIIQYLLICWNNQMINWLIIGKFIVLNQWCNLLNVRASFTVKGHDKADLVPRRPDYPSGRCPYAKASWDDFLWLDGDVPHLCYQSNETSLLVLSTDAVSIDDDFVTN